MNSQSDKLSGKAKQLGGKLTNDKQLQAKGKLQELTGKTKELAEKATDNIKAVSER